jgi:hypothetical protein
LNWFALRDRGRIRTFNRLIRSQVLYPVELHGHHLYNSKLHGYQM